MPRVYGDGHIAGPDMPGLLLWAATRRRVLECAPRGARGMVADPGRGALWAWRSVEKMAAVAVIPASARLAVDGAPAPGRSIRRTGLAIGLTESPRRWPCCPPLVLAFVEIVRLARLLPPPVRRPVLHRPEGLTGRAASCMPLANLDRPRICFGSGVDHPVPGAWSGRPWKPGPRCLTFGPLLAGEPSSGGGRTLARLASTTSRSNKRGAPRGAWPISRSSIHRRTL